MYTTGMRNRIIIVVILSLFCAFVLSPIDKSIVEGDSAPDLASEPSPQKTPVLPATPNNTQPPTVEGDSAPDLASEPSPLSTPVLPDAPSSTQPTFENPHDFTFFYARARNYEISVNITDTEGYGDVINVSLSLFDNSRVTEYWTVNYNEDANFFTKNDPGGYITLVTGSCRYWKSADDLDILFAISIDWDHPDTTNTDTRVYSIDSTNSTTDWYETDWDVETRLDYVVSPSVTNDDSGTVDRGDLEETFHITGTVEYYGSASSVRPPSNQVDVWIAASQYGSNVGPWSDLTLPSGVFDVTCYADDQVGQDTYTVRVVPEGAGSGGTDLYYTSSVTDTYIADQIRVQSYNPLNSSRVDISSVAYERIILYYAYDMTAVVDGTVTANGLSALYSTFHLGWVFSDTKASPQSVTYNSVSYTGGTHGLDGSVDQNGQSLVQIWDRLVITIQATTIAPSNGQEVTFDLMVIYDYDSLACTTYELVVDRNGTWWYSFSHSNMSAFTDNNTNATYVYTIRQITSESLYGITVFNSNNVTVTWSVAQSPSITLPLEIFIIIIIVPLAISLIACFVAIRTSVRFSRFRSEWKKAIEYSKAVISGTVARALSNALKTPYQSLEKVSSEIGSLQSTQLNNTKAIENHGKRVKDSLQKSSNAIKKVVQEDYPPYVLGVVQSVDITLDQLLTDWAKLIDTLKDALDLLKDVKDAVEEEKNRREFEKKRAENQKLLVEYKETIDELRLIIAELVQVGGQPGG